MKVGVDGVMLGAWANCANAKNILDVGTGTGLIALMLAQRNPFAIIDAVEIDADACGQAGQNFADSAWKNRLQIFCKSFQQFANETTQKYDLIVSNPPYFIASLQSPDVQRTAARHAALLSQDDLIAGVDKILSPDGKFVAIFPYVEANVFIVKAAAKNIFCNKKMNVKPNAQKPVKRIMLEFSRDKQTLSEGTICIEMGTRNVYTEEYKQLTRDFYLKF